VFSLGSFLFVYVAVAAGQQRGNAFFSSRNREVFSLSQNDRPDISSEGAPVIDKTILINVNRNKYPVVRPSWALKPGLTDRLVVGRKVTLTLTLFSLESVPRTHCNGKIVLLVQPELQEGEVGRSRHA
jgi:hypothetical protein